MPWGVEYTDQFGDWWQELTERDQDAVTARVELLMECGPNLRTHTPPTSEARATA